MKNEKKEKNPAAVALGKLGGSKGGKARAAKLTKERRHEIAKKAAQTRWGIKSLIFILFFLLPVDGRTDEWKKEDIALQGVYTTLHLIDWSQTLKIRKSKNSEEGNHYLGSRPSRSKVNTYFAGTLIGHYLIAKWLDEPWRKVWQSFWIGRQYSAINHNKRDGFKISIDF